ncbi:MAG: NAD-dependent epimerase/dehydratase family protein [Lachnospiraceae bacterium]|nr:NAD-dependent epimerase/dehydratase family protein [Lachnospiraceae bacterium]
MEETAVKNVLITGGTVFVSRYVAEYYVKKGYHVFVLNRNRKEQPEGVTLIEADRHDIGSRLQDYHFDVIFDITAYTANDIDLLLNAVGSYRDYIFVSSSAVYPEYCPQPFGEHAQVGRNKFWGKYGTDKIEAEQMLCKRNPDAYILRPPYLYGPMNNVYREAFVFECALKNRKFYLPQEGQMKLQFFYIDDLCRFMDIILEQRPDRHIFNVGNRETVSIRDWAALCYKIAGKGIEFVNVNRDIEQRNYFSFYNYEYCLDVAAQEMLMPKTTLLEEGLQKSFEWYLHNADAVNKKPYIEYIDTHFI